MNYKGVDYTVVETTTGGVWKWQFQIGESVRSGKTETRIELMARRRAQLQINLALSRTAAIGDSGTSHAAHGLGVPDNVQRF